MPTLPPKSKVIKSAVSDSEDENEQITKDEEGADDEVLIEPDEDDNPEEIGKKKNDAIVYVSTIYDHRCTIGGKSYVFKAGVKTPVPKNVQVILSRAGKLRG